MRSFELALVAFFIGAILLISAYVIGILNVETCWAGSPTASYVLTSCSKAFSIRKQVGFGLALNWSIGLCFLLPFFVFCAAETLRGGISAIREMSRRGMFVFERDWSSPSFEEMSGLLRRRRYLVAIGIVGMVAILATIFLLRDFTTTVGEYYVNPQALAGLVMSDPEKEADWSVAAPVCIYTNDTNDSCQQLAQSSVINGIFSGIAYFYLPYCGAIAAIGFMAGFGLFARFIFAAELRAAGIVVVPDIRSSDARRGFEVLEPMFLYSVIGCFVLFAMGYLVTLQNVYLRSSSENIFSFVIPFVPDKIELDGSALIQAMKESASFIVINGNSVAVTIIGFMFLGIVLATAAAVLGREAKAGQERIRAELTRSPMDPNFGSFLGGTTPQAAGEAIDTAVAWSLKWPSVNSVIFWLVLGVISLLFVRVGFFLVGAGLLYVSRRAFGKG